MANISDVISRLDVDIKKELESIDAKINELNSAIAGIEAGEGDDYALEDYEDKLVAVERSRGQMMEIVKIIDEIKSRQEELEVTSKQIPNGKGPTITEEVYNITDLIRIVQRDTMIKGSPCSYFKATIGDYDTPSMIAELDYDGDELVRQNYQNLTTQSYYRYTRLLANDNEEHNPDKDFISITSRNVEDGYTKEVRRPILDKDGNLLGKYEENEDHVQEIGGMRHTNIVKIMKRTVMTKDGPSELKSIVNKDSDGSFSRFDFLDEKQLSFKIFDEMDNSEESREQLALVDSQSHLADLEGVPQEMKDALNNEDLEVAKSTNKIYTPVDFLGDEQIERLKAETNKAKEEDEFDR